MHCVQACDISECLKTAFIDKDGCILFVFLFFSFFFQLPCIESLEVSIGPPLFFESEDQWQIKIELLRTAADLQDEYESSIPFAFFVNNGVQGIQPCLDVTDICCIARTMSVSAWKGDIDMMNVFDSKCKTPDITKSSWSDLTQSVGREGDNAIFLTLTRNDLLASNKHAVYVEDGSYDISILVLLMRQWSMWDENVEQTVFVETIFKTARINLQQQNKFSVISAVDSDVDCANEKPANSFFVTRNTNSENMTNLYCEWFCEAEYIRCPLYARDDETSCVLKPAITSRVFVTTVGVLSLSGGIFQDKISTFNQTKELQKSTKELATWLNNDGLAVRECLLVVTTAQLLRDAQVAYRSSENSASLDRATVLQLTETFSITSDMSPVRPHPRTKIAYDVSLEDRFLPGFLEYKILYFEEIENQMIAEQGQLSAQAEIFRISLKNFFMYGTGNSTVLYISNVQVLDRGFQENAKISGWEFTLILIWGLLIVWLFAWNLLCPCDSTACTDASALSCSICKNPCSKGCCVNSKHSPRGQRTILITTVFLLLLFLVFAITYISVLLPNMAYMTPDKLAFMTLVFFGATLFPAIAMYVVMCTCLKVCLTRKH